MGGITGWTRAMIVGGLAMTAAACASYPSEPRYSTRPMPTDGQAAPPAGSPYGPPGNPYPQGAYDNSGPARVEPPVTEPTVTAPVAPIEGGSLPPAGETPPPATSPYAPQPTYTPPVAPPATVGPPASTMPGAAYVIQPGDTISGVGRRFQTPVQTLIDLNGLGPRGQISTGQRVILPDSAVDMGSDPYATGPSPVGVMVPENGAPPPPPPPPPSGNPALPSRTPVDAAPTPGAAPGSVALQWPVRGDIVRSFGPVGMGERNNGINIGASAGAAVNAAAAGRVAYVGDDLVGQGLTVLIVHRDGWRTVYGHLGSATVRDGDDVRAGQQIGTVGLTAGDGRPSIHFETRQMRGDEPVAIDPLSVLPR